MSTWTEPWRVVSVADSQHVYGAEDIATGERKEVHLARMSSYADELLAVTAELLGVFTTLKKQGEFQTQAMQAMAFSADNDTNWVVQVKWPGVDESGMT